MKDTFMKNDRRARRFDYGQMREATRTPQGFLKVPGYATRVGVFPYMDGSGKIRRELRHPVDVFDPQSMETLKYAPVTIEHPPEMLNPANVADYSVGHTTEMVKKDGDKLETELIVEQDKGISAIEDEGLRELSCGYEADIVDEEGDFNGAPYDARQVNIRYNHLAMVRRGRAGPEIRMRLDSADAVMQGQISEPVRGEFAQSGASNSDAEPRLGDEVNAIGEPANKRLVISGQEVELPSDVADTVQDMMDRFDEMRAKVAQLEESMKQSRKDKQDMDINQPGVSPQVKVEQQGPDGRSAGGKMPAKPGTITGGPMGKADDEEEHGVVGGEKPNSRAAGAKALADEEMEKEDDDMEKDDADTGAPNAPLINQEAKQDPAGHEDYEAGAGTGAGGAAMSPVDQLKKDLEDARSAYDAAQAKLDNYASMAMGKNEMRGDSKAFNAQVRNRVKLERQAEKLVPYEVAQKFDSMTDDQIRAAVIQHHAPKADLKGKSTVYLQTRFDHLLENFEEEDVSAPARREAGRRMLGMGPEGEERMDSEQEINPDSARLRMIRAGRDEYKSSPFAATKK